MKSRKSEERSPLKFFILLFVISTPFWLAGDLAEEKLPLPFNLPLGALVLICPMAAALILVYRDEGQNGVINLLSRCFDYRIISGKAWYLAIFLLMPALMAIEYILMRLVGMPVPDPQFSALLLLAVFFPVFFIGGIGEEIGWTGYALDPLQAKRTALKSAIILGVVWAVWHIMPYIQAQYPPLWVIGQSAATVMLRVLIVWIYNNTGKNLFAAISFHAMSNISQLVLFPIYGSHFDPVIAFILLAATVVVVVFLWGEETLACYRCHKSM